MGRAEYDPYGNLIANTIPLAVTDRLFTGQIWEADLGLYNYRARFYDPLTGSFTQPDSIVPDAMDPRAWNRFGYVYGNPANFTDPSGHIVETFFDAIDFYADTFSCLGGDGLSCAFAAYDAVALITPGLPASYGDQFLRRAGGGNIGGGGRFIPPGGSGGSGYDPLDQFVKDRLGTAPQNINCYGCALKEWPEAQGIAPVIDDLNTSPWGNDFGSMLDFVQKHPNGDLIENAIHSNFDNIDRIDLRRGDLITWKKTQTLNFGFGDGPQPYQYISHAGVYLGNNKVFAKMGHAGAYEIRSLDDPFLADAYGTISYWRAK